MGDRQAPKTFTVCKKSAQNSIIRLEMKYFFLVKNKLARKMRTDSGQFESRIRFRAIEIPDDPFSTGKVRSLSKMVSYCAGQPTKRWLSLSSNLLGVSLSVKLILSGKVSLIQNNFEYSGKPKKVLNDKQIRSM